MLSRRELLAASAAVAVLPALPAFAATPREVLVVGQQLDGLISLDPAECFETIGREVLSNIYEQLLEPDPANPNKLKGMLAEKWDISPDGMTFTFHLRGDAKFASGRPVTADDAAFSLQRVIKLNKSPAFILSQFGFTKDNVESAITATDPHTLVVKVAKQVAPTLVLYCLTADVGSVVDRAEVMAHVEGDDLGNLWMKTHSAGSNAFVLQSWKASESVMLTASPNALAKAKTKRVILKHISDPSAQLLELQKGDVDIARDLTAEQLRTAEKDAKLRLSTAPQGNLVYVGMNVAKPELAKPEVRQAIKWAIDYDGIQQHITPYTHIVHQSFLPEGFPGALNNRPFKRDVAKAKELLAQAGLAGGFEVTLDHASIQPNADIAQAIQANLAEVGIKVSLVAGESRQVFTRTRARQHQLALLGWGPDYFDPHTNAEAFNVNPDNTEKANNRTLAWRASWQDTDLSDRTLAAARELDPAKRMAEYESIQKDSQQRSPFAMMLQTKQYAAVRKVVSGFEIAPLYARINYIHAVKSA